MGLFEAGQRTEHDLSWHRLNLASWLRLDAQRRAVITFLCCAPVAQLDRASGYEPEGREFESPRAHHIFQ